MAPRQMPEMRKAAVLAAVTALLLKRASAAGLGDPATGTSPTSDTGQGNWHKEGRLGSGPYGGDGGSAEDCIIVIGAPCPSGPDAPHPCPPDPIPLIRARPHLHRQGQLADLPLPM
jgi:hypothetical protein